MVNFLIVFASEETMAAAKPEAVEFTLNPSKVQIEEVIKDTQCGFCCLTLDEKQAPRALPCGQVQCTMCKEGDVIPLRYDVLNID